MKTEPAMKAGSVLWGGRNGECYTESRSTRREGRRTRLGRVVSPRTRPAIIRAAVIIRVAAITRAAAVIPAVAVTRAAVVIPAAARRSPAQQILRVKLCLA